MQPLRWKNLCLILRGDDLNLLRFRPENANHQIVTRAMRSKDAKRIIMRAVQERCNLVRVERMNDKRTHRDRKRLTAQVCFAKQVCRPFCHLERSGAESKDPVEVSLKVSP